MIGALTSHADVEVINDVDVNARTRVLPYGAWTFALTATWTFVRGARPDRCLLVILTGPHPERASRFVH